MKFDFDSANLLLMNNIEKFLNYFELEYRINKNKIVLRCPIHESDNDNSMNIFTDGHNFKCWTRHCENEIGYSINNLIKSLFDKKTGKKSSYYEFKNFIELIAGQRLTTVDHSAAEQKKFTQFIKSSKQFTPTVTRNQVRLNLKIPSEYFIGRGFSREILNKYDIGLCTKRDDELFMRTVVPVYNEEFKLIGRLGRSMFPKCIICNKHHDINRLCPTNRIEEMWASKWRNSEGFKTGNYLYNLWYAKDQIREKQCVILVEGCGDVLRLEESGVHIGLGLFGLELTAQKLDLLNSLGIMRVVLALDSDEAGQDATVKIYNNISRYFNVDMVNIGKKDIGELPIPQVRDIFKEFI